MHLPILTNITLKPWLNIVHKPMMRFMRIDVIGNIAAQVADDSLIFVVIELDV